MARFDKYDPISGGFRAPLENAITSDDVGVVVGVGLNADGRIETGGANSGIVGVICPVKPMAAGEIIDTMTHGEIVELEDLDAGTSYFVADDDGALSDTADTRVGHTVEAQRLVVRVTPA